MWSANSLPCSCASRLTVSKASTTSPRRNGAFGGNSKSRAGKDSTLVAASMRRHWRLGGRTGASSASTALTSVRRVSFGLAVAKAAPAAATQSARRRGRRSRQRGDGSRSSIAIAGLRRIRAAERSLMVARSLATAATPVVPVIGLNHALHQGMAHHVGLGEVHGRDALDALERRERVGNARGRAARQVDLRQVARDRHTGALTEPGQKHFHLDGGGVLGL